MLIYGNLTVEGIKVFINKKVLQEVNIRINWGLKNKVGSENYKNNII